MKCLLAILFLTAVSYSQSIDVTVQGTKAIFVIKDCDKRLTGINRELINLDNKLREREDLECRNGVNNSWFDEQLYKGRWLIRIWDGKTLIAQKEFEIK